jgi:hypothetical protein
MNKNLLMLLWEIINVFILGGGSARVLNTAAGGAANR